MGKFKCGFCGKEWDSIPERMKCERECQKKQERANAEAKKVAEENERNMDEKRIAELHQQIDKLQNEIDKIISKYSQPCSLLFDLFRI